MNTPAPHSIPFLCNHCFKWNTYHTTPTCHNCKYSEASTCFPAPILLLRDQYVFTVDEWNKHAMYPVTQRENLRILRDAYQSAAARESEKQKALKTAKGKLKAFFKDREDGGDEEGNIHDIYAARKKQIEERVEEKSHLQGVLLDRPVLRRRVDDRAWVIKFSVLVAFAKVNIPCLQKHVTRLADRLATLLAFLQDLDGIDKDNDVVIELNDRRILTVHACIDALVSGQMDFESGDIAENISQINTPTGRIMAPDEAQRYGGS